MIKVNLFFWKNFFKKVGKVDIILDDGGHTNYQQIITLNSCVPHIKDDGLMVVEDTHASYIKKNFIILASIPLSIITRSLLMI